jgi:hypothetical protein
MLLLPSTQLQMEMKAILILLELMKFIQLKRKQQNILIQHHIAILVISIGN